MAKFVLIEQSMRKLGGHFHQYATQILQAAEQAGYEPVLAVHCQFRDFDRLPSHWAVYALFPHASDRIHRVPRSYGIGLDSTLRLEKQALRACWYRLIDSLTDRFKSAISSLRWYRRCVRVRGFAGACQQLFQRVELQPGDQVYCCTMSDLDLQGLVRFLRRHEASKQADWHVQFHFRIFRGRDPDYDSQSARVRPLQRRLAAALQRVPEHRLYFYTTTESLARQFRRLRVVPLQTLPWPVGPQFHVVNRPPQLQRPLRLVCAGGLRREKGVDDFQQLVQSLWPAYLQSGRAQLVFQADGKRRTRAMLGPLPAPVVTARSLDVDQLPEAPLVCVPHPLGPDQYAAYINNADIGLLLYHADEYYVRCSGVLVEMLAAGVPVIVPAGCWLGDQVEQINRRHWELPAGTDVVARFRAAELSWRSPSGAQVAAADGSLIVDRAGLSARVRLPRVVAGGDVLVTARAPEPAEPGLYVKCVLKQYAGDGRLVGQLARVAGVHQDAEAAAVSDSPASAATMFTALFPLKDHATHLHLTLSNAYHDQKIELPELQICCLPPVAATGGHRPAGYVGLTAAEPDDFAELLADMIEHFGHYRQAARSLAPWWRQQHAPEATIRRLAQRAAERWPHRWRRAG